MSSDRAVFLAQRRSALRARCAVQRVRLAETTEHIQERLSGIDRGIDTLRRYVAHPLVLAGGVALLAMIGPRRVFRWAGSSAVLLSTGKRVLRLLR